MTGVELYWILKDMTPEQLQNEIVIKNNFDYIKITSVEFKQIEDIEGNIYQAIVIE